MNTFLIWLRQWFCNHKWELIKQGNLTQEDLYRRPKITGYYQDYVCEKCLCKVEIRW